MLGFSGDLRTLKEAGKGRERSTEGVKRLKVRQREFWSEFSIHRGQPQGSLLISLSLTVLIFQGRKLQLCPPEAPVSPKMSARLVH